MRLGLHRRKTCSHSPRVTWSSCTPSISARTRNLVSEKRVFSLYLVLEGRGLLEPYKSRLRDFTNKTFFNGESLRPRGQTRAIFNAGQNEAMFLFSIFTSIKSQLSLACNSPLSVRIAPPSPIPAHCSHSCRELWFPHPATGRHPHP